MQKYELWAYLVCVVCLLVGCNQGIGSQASPIMTSTQQMTETHSSTRTIQPPKTPTVPSAIKPTETLTPFPTSKPSLIELYQGAGDGVDEVTICMAVYSPFPQFILYEDGQLVFYNDGEYQETHLSEEQIKSLMQKIEATGYFKLGDDFNQHYDLPKDIEMGGGGWDVIVTVKGKLVDIDPALARYLLKPVQETVDIIRSYQPEGDIKTYKPEKISLTVMDAHTGEYFPTPDPSAKIQAWPTALFSLNSTIYLRELSKNEMDTLAKLNLFTGVPELRLFKQNGVVYYVLGCPPWYGW